jgi:hypothetical protein
MNAIKRVYASVLSPDPLLYRQRMGLIDYDERMAVLIQKVQGSYHRHYFFPIVAGVGYSSNPFRWNPKIRREEGFLRLVWGLGTRAVDRVANEYPRLVALSHPQLRPDIGAKKARKYSQHFIDLVDLKNNLLKTLPVREVIGDDYPALRYLASVDRGEYLAPILSRMDAGNGDDLVLTFEGLTQDGRFVTLMKTILNRLERYYTLPVDIEFTVDIKPKYPRPEYTVHLLQCRPLVSHEWMGNIEIPEGIPEEDLIFSACKLVPQGVVSGLRYIVYIDPVEYSRMPDNVTRLEVARVVGRLNKRLEGERFILMGPGRWGSSNVDLGVKVTYADIYNTAVLVEIPLAKEGSTAAMLNVKFLTDSPNMLAELLPADATYAPYVRVIDVPAVAGGSYLEIVMNGEQERAVGYLKACETKDG